MTRIEAIAKCRPAGIILREKDLTEDEYRTLAKQVMEVCGEHGVPCILHTFADVAAELHAEAVHLPLPVLRKLCQAENEVKKFSVIGTSCHSVEDAKEAQKLGCTYITVGHIFATDCKKGLPPRGIPFLEQVCRSVSMPVFAIGGITLDNLPLVRQAGAAGGCVMSGLMKCQDVSTWLPNVF